jgi:hypothetical protein
MAQKFPLGMQDQISITNLLFYNFTIYKMWWYAKVGEKINSDLWIAVRSKLGTTAWIEFDKEQVDSDGARLPLPVPLPTVTRHYHCQVKA